MNECCAFSFNYRVHVKRDNYKSCLQASSMTTTRSALKYVNNYIYKLIIPDLTKNTWYDDFCLYFLVSVWETSTKPGCNRCFFASKYGVALSFCVTRTSGRNEVNAFKKSFIFWTKLCLFFLKIDDNLLNVNCYLPTKLREVQWNMLI